MGENIRGVDDELKNPDSERSSVAESVRGWGPKPRRSLQKSGNFFVPGGIQVMRSARISGRVFPFGVADVHVVLEGL